jgi:hypothetical protein
MLGSLVELGPHSSQICSAPGSLGLDLIFLRFQLKFIALTQISAIATSRGGVTGLAGWAVAHPRFGKKPNTPHPAGQPSPSGQHVNIPSGSASLCSMPHAPTLARLASLCSSQPAARVAAACRPAAHVAASRPAPEPRAAASALPAAARPPCPCAQPASRPSARPPCPCDQPQPPRHVATKRLAPCHHRAPSVALPCAQ